MCSIPDAGGPLGPAERKQLELTIHRHGWACLGVFHDRSGLPGWSYTVGLAHSPPSGWSDPSCGSGPSPEQPLLGEVWWN